MTFLSGQLLIAMPQLEGEPFERAVIYLCAHTEEGAMGLVINKMIDISVPALLTKLGVEHVGYAGPARVHLGGPVESGCGFVLHSTDYTEDRSLRVADDIALTATMEVLRAIGRGGGPKRSLLALGYAGWGKGQLESEIRDNGWLHVPADAEMLFDGHHEDKWRRALGKLGVDPSLLSAESGHA